MTDDRLRTTASADGWFYPMDSFCSLTWRRTLKALSPKAIILSAQMPLRLLRWHAHALHECPFCHTHLTHEDSAHLASCPQYYGARRRVRPLLQSCVTSFVVSSTVAWDDHGDSLRITTTARTYTVSWVDDLATVPPVPQATFTWSGLWYLPPDDYTWLSARARETISVVTLHALSNYSHDPSAAPIPDGTDMLGLALSESEDTSLDLDSVSTSSSGSAGDS